MVVSEKSTTFASDKETNSRNHLDRAATYKRQRIMNTTILEEAQNMKVRFHIGRGGQFHNAGHKTYVGTVNDLSDCFGDSIIFSEDENGKTLPDSDWRLVDGGGNVILSGRDEIESETGILDWDGEYDTDIVRYIEDCTDEEYQLIIDAYNNHCYVDEDVLIFACNAMDKLYASTINTYPSNMEVFTQNGCINLDRDNYSVYTEDEEDEVREQLRELDFIDRTVENIISAMELHDWFSENEENKL